MIHIHKYTQLLLMFVLMTGMTACKKNNGFNDVISSDKTKPEPVSNIKVDNFNGGATITYDLPNSENILYVLAKYKINNSTSREAKSSYYQDTILVNGFAEAKSYDVTLYTVSRANVSSDPITVTVNPTTPVYKLVQPTISMTADFGGINVKASNSSRQEVGLIFLSYNASTRAMEIQDQFFTKDPVIDYSVRGFSSIAQDFAVYVTDRWGNISDTLKRNITPIFEVALDKSKFTVLSLGSDTPLDFGWNTPYLWDGKGDGNGWHTKFGEALPYTTSFGVGGSYKLSRFVLFERLGSGFTYNYGNPKEFSLWGTNVTNPSDQRLPIVADEGAVVGDWVNLGNFKFPDPPSGNPPGQTVGSDEDFVRKGVNFKVSLQAPAVRFLRISVASNWGNVAAAHLMEITPYGTPQ